MELPRVLPLLALLTGTVYAWSSDVSSDGKVSIIISSKAGKSRHATIVTEVNEKGEDSFTRDGIIINEKGDYMRSALYTDMNKKPVFPTPVSLSTGCEEKPIFAGDTTPGKVFQAKVKNPATGRCRQCKVCLPTDFDSLDSVPLVLDFHGDMSGAKRNFDFDAGTINGKTLDELAKVRYGSDLMNGKTVPGFKFVSGRCWGEYLSRNHDGSGGRMGWEPFECSGGCSGDVDFVRTMVQVLVDNFKVDPTRVFASGHSSGGLFMFRLAYEASDIFAGLAPRAGRMWTNKKTIPSGTIVPICIPFMYQIAGKDSHNPLGKNYCINKASRIDDSCEAFGYEASILRIAESSGCTVTVKDETVPRYNRLIGSEPPKVMDTKDGNRYAKYTFSGCSSGTQVLFYNWVDETHSFKNAGDATLEERVAFFASISSQGTSCSKGKAAKGGTDDASKPPADAAAGKPGMAGKPGKGKGKARRAKKVARRAKKVGRRAKKVGRRANESKGKGKKSKKGGKATAGAADA